MSADDSLTSFEFTFEPVYNFRCTNCGVCCKYSGGVSLTRREYSRLSRSLDSSFFSRVRHASFPYLMSNANGCVFLKDKKCSIHGEHPLFCRIYPLSFGCHSNKIFVNLIRCEGVSTGPGGPKVDRGYVDGVVAEMSGLEGEGFAPTLFGVERKLTSGPRPLIGDRLLSSFEGRRLILLAVADMMADPQFAEMSEGSCRLQSIILGPFHTLRKILEQSLKERGNTDAEKSYTVSAPSIRRALDDVRHSLQSSISGGRERLFAAVNLADRLQSYDSETGKIETLSPEDDLTLLDYYDTPVRFKVRAALEPVRFTKEAVTSETRYVQEILRRVGMGGIPYYMAVDEGANKLSMILRQLETYAKYLRAKYGAEAIDVAIMGEAICNTDTHIMDLLL